MIRTPRLPRPLRRPAAAAVRAASFPWRLSRRKISVQLIYSQVLVVLLTILLLEVVAIGVALGLLAFGVIDDQPLDYSVAQRAQTLGITLSSSAVASQLADDGTLDAAQRADLDRQLGGLVAGAYVPDDNFAPANIPDDAPNLALALVVNRDGIVVASSDAATAPAGQSAAGVGVPLTEQLTSRVLELAGQPTRFGNLYVTDTSDRVTVASHPIFADGEIVGAVTLQGVHGTRAMLSDIIRPSTITGFALTNGVVLAVLSIPALLVSIPVGVWRARRISRRLSALADAADAMGEGDLSRRIDVRGEDEIARVSTRFNDMIARLQATDRARKSFVANVSHELRTPLAIVQGNLERLRGRPPGTPLTEDERRTLDALHQETITLARLIDDLFTLARIEDANLPLEALPLDVAVVVDQAVEGIKGVAWQQRRVSVESVVPPGLPAVVSDRTRLRQILGNLLYNALRHTPEGGLIVVDARYAAGDTVVELSVADTGFGMSEEELARVFERYYQAERPGRHAEGSGLGLAIVKQLVEAQGGTVGVESAPGAGTRFHVTLPIAARDATSASGRREAGQTARETRTNLPPA